MGLFEDDGERRYSGYLTSAEHDEIVRECFHQNRVRNCSSCSAHPDNGGQCCYGDPEKFEPSDRECKMCPYEFECEQEVIDAQAELQYHTRKEPRGKLRKRRRVRERTRIRTREEQRARPRVTDAEDRYYEEEVGNESERMFQRFMKDVVWGALQGAFEMALAFLRGHRWPS